MPGTVLRARDLGMNKEKSLPSRWGRGVETDRQENATR